MISQPNKDNTTTPPKGNDLLANVSGCYYAENGTVYRNDDDLNIIVCFLNRDTGGYMSLPKDVAEKVAEMLNKR